MFGKTKKIKEPAYITRMRVEIDAVNSRLQALADFETSDTFKALNNYQKDLIVAQYGAMLAYRNVLNIRISYEMAAVKDANAALASAKKDAKK